MVQETWDFRYGFRGLGFKVVPTMFFGSFNLCLEIVRVHVCLGGLCVNASSFVSARQGRDFLVAPLRKFQ